MVFMSSEMTHNELGDNPLYHLYCFIGEAVITARVSHCIKNAPGEPGSHCAMGFTFRMAWAFRRVEPSSTWIDHAPAVSVTPGVMRTTSRPFSATQGPVPSAGFPVGSLTVN